MKTQKREKLYNFSRATQPGKGRAGTGSQAAPWASRLLATTSLRTCFRPAVLLALFHLIPGRGRYCVFVFLFLWCQNWNRGIQVPPLKTIRSRIESSLASHNRTAFSPQPQTAHWWLRWWHCWPRVYGRWRGGEQGGGEEEGHRPLFRSSALFLGLGSGLLE